MSSILYPAKIIATLLNLTERRIQQLAKDGIIPKADKGKYPLTGCVQGYVKFLQALSSGKGVIDEDTHFQKTRLVKAQADKTELEVNILNGTLIPSALVEGVWSDMVSAFRARMLGLPNRLAGQIILLKKYQDIEELLRKSVYEALSELSEYDPARYTKTPDMGDSEKDSDINSTAPELILK